MKSLLWVIPILAITLSSCRKKVVRDVPTANSIGALHCMNGVQDEDEVGLDCGGADCDQCSQLDAPCTLNDNEIYYLESVIYTTDAFINQTYSVSTSGSTFRAYTADGDSIHIVFSGLPDVTKMYSGTAYSSNIDNDEVYIEYFQPFPLDDYIGSGDVYVNHANGQWTIRSCDYSFTTWGSPTPPNPQYFSITF